MESAIPTHLLTQRTRQTRLPQDYTPPYPSFVARFTPGVKRVAMAYFGLQYRDEAPDEATSSLDGARPGTLGPRDLHRRGRLHQRDHDRLLGRRRSLRRIVRFTRQQLDGG